MSRMLIFISIALCVCLSIEGRMNDEKYDLYLSMQNAETKDALNAFLKRLEHRTPFEKYEFSCFLFSRIEDVPCQECKGISKLKEEEWQNSATLVLMVINHMWGLNVRQIPVGMSQSRSVPIIAAAENAVLHKFLRVVSNGCANNLHSIPSEIKDESHSELKEEISLQTQIKNDFLLMACSHEIDKITLRLKQLPKLQYQKMLTWMVLKLNDFRKTYFLNRHLLSNQHNLSLIGGKCAVVLEQLLKTKIVPINKSTPREKISEEQKRLESLVCEKYGK